MTTALVQHRGGPAQDPPVIAARRLRSLHVLWREPSEGRRHLIGRLDRLGEKHWRFAYVDLTSAIQHGFLPLVEFPDATAIVESPWLFPTFAERIPSANRPDFQRLMTLWGVDVVDDPLLILARSGGIQLTDRLELCELRDDDDDLEHPLVFRAAAAHHRPPGLLAVDDVVTLLREPDNEFDPHAVKLISPDGSWFGYVPKPYAALVARHLDGGSSLDVRALRNIPEPECVGGRWTLELRRR